MINLGSYKVGFRTRDYLRFEIDSYITSKIEIDVPLILAPLGQ